MQKMIFILAFGVLIVACGNRDTYSYPPTAVSTSSASAPIDGPYENFGLRPEEPVTPVKALVYSKIICATKNCPSYVGMMAFVRHDVQESKTNPDQMVMVQSVGTCTVSLIADDLVMTNSHCLQQGRKNYGSECPLTEVSFPKNGQFEAERADCAQVISASELALRVNNISQELLPDYAILKLKKPLKRTPLKLNFDGVPDNMPLSMYAADPVGERLAWSKVVETKCVSQYRSAKLPGYNHPLSATIALAGCLANDGNSGAPVIDSKGEARAVVSNSLGNRSMVIDNETIDTQISFATNVACLILPEKVSLHVPNEICKKQNGVDINDVLIKMARESGLESIQASIDKWASENNEFFHWKTEELNTNNPNRKSVMASVVPSCIVHPDQWKSQTASRFSYVPWRWGQKDLITVFSPLWFIKGKVDTKMRLATEVKQNNNFILNIEIDRKDLIRDGKIKARVESREISDPNVIIAKGNLELPLCK